MHAQNVPLSVLIIIHLAEKSTHGKLWPETILCFNTYRQTSTTNHNLKAQRQFFRRMLISISYMPTIGYQIHAIHTYLVLKVHLWTAKYPKSKRFHTSTSRLCDSLNDLKSFYDLQKILISPKQSPTSGIVINLYVRSIIFVNSVALSKYNKYSRLLPNTIYVIVYQTVT